MGAQDQHDAAFKGIMEYILSQKCVRTITGSEVAKFPLRVDMITERVCPLSSDLGLLAWLINQLPPVIVHEFKGPTEYLQEQHIWRLISYCGLFAMEKKIAFFESGIAAVMIYVVTSHKIQRLIDSLTTEIIPGVTRYSLGPEQDGFQLVFINVNQLELSTDNLPFLIFREQDIERVFEMIQANSDAKRLYGYMLYKIQRKHIQRILRMKGIDVTEVATLKELISDFGIQAVIKEVGLKAVIEEVGVKAVIEEVGVKAVLEEAGIGTTIEMITELIDTGQLDSEQIEDLKELIRKLNKKLGL